MYVMAIDPGPVVSGHVMLQVSERDIHVANWGCEGNDDVAELVSRHGQVTDDARLVVEKTVYYGRMVNAAIFETCVQTGRFMEAFGFHDTERMSRGEVLRELCGTTHAGPPQLRAAVLDHWGGNEKAVGTKKAPGPLYGIKGKDVWSALGLGLAYIKTRREDG